MDDPYHIPYSRREHDDLRYLLSRLWRRRGRIALVGILSAVAVSIYSLYFTKPYVAEALVRVDALVDAGDSGVARGPDVNLDTEIDFIRSRSMFQLALGRLGPNVDIYAAEGTALTSLRTLLNGRPDNRYRSAQPGFQIDTLQVPDRWLNQRLTLSFTEKGGYVLTSADGQLLLRAAAGSPAPDNPPPASAVTLRISHVTVAPGSRFILIARSPKDVIATLQKQLSVETIGRRERSGYLRLTFVSDNPVFAKQFLGALTDTYIARAYEQSTHGRLEALSRLEEQLNQTRAALEQAETARRDFQQQSGSFDMSQETKLWLQQMMAIEDQLRTLHARQKELAAFYTPAHPALQSISDQVSYLDNERKRLQQAIDALPETQRKLLLREREVETQKDLYTLTSQKLFELRSEAASITGYATLIDAPELLPHNNFNKLIKSIILGFAIGVLAGATFVYTLAFSPLASVRTGDQVLDGPEVPVLGRLQRVSALHRVWLQRTARGIPLMVGENNRDGIRADALELNRNLTFAAFGDANPVTIVTALSGNHASAAIAMNIAAIHARGARTLLIDGSMQPHGIHQFFRRDPVPGLSDVLIGEATIDKALHEVTRGLYFLPGGSATSMNGNLLRQQRFFDMIQQCTQKFSHIVLYYPAIDREGLASAFVQWAGSLALVISRGDGREAARAAVARLQRLRNFKGLILDDLE